MSGDKSISARVGVPADDTMTCPHCGYENPRPRLQIMKTVKCLLCRSCQREFPIPEEDR